MIPHLAQQEMMAHAMHECQRDREACGLVGLETWRVFPLRNVARDPAHYYSADEEDIRAAVHALGGEKFAVYHSHTKTAAVPSEGDRDGATYPDQIIISCVTGKMRRYKVIDRNWTIVHNEEESE